MKDKSRKKRDKIERIKKGCFTGLMLLSGLYYFLLGREEEAGEMRLLELSIEESVREIRETSIPPSPDTQALPQTLSNYESINIMDSMDNMNNTDDIVYLKTESDTENITGIKYGLININTASIEQLKTLPGIGDAVAKSIIEYRELNGGFSGIEEIKNVNRIGEKTYEKIKDLISV